jgi:nucleoside-diphosphate-sugar epimerase
MILVTGGTGFLGQHLLQLLEQTKQKIRATYRGTFPTNFPEHLIKNIEWVECDITHIDDVEKALLHCTHVYHCASTVSFSKNDHQQMMYNNVEGTANLVNECLLQKIDKLIHVSSTATFGRVGNKELITEKTDWEDSEYNSAYAQSKHLSEMEVWRGIAEGLNACIVNPAIILGEGDWHKGSSALFKTTYNQFAWFTNGSTAWVDVQDVAKAMLLLMNSDVQEQRYILSSGNFTYKEIFTKMALAFGKKPPSKFASPLLTSLLWRIELIKSWFTNKPPKITKETAFTAQQNYEFDNQKFLTQFPAFAYTSIDDTINRCCGYYANMVEC